MTKISLSRRQALLGAASLTAASSILSPKPVSASAWSERKKFVDVGDGLKMAYVEMGDPDGDPIIFLHGNPTSSYLWRKVMPHCAALGRCIAPDLIGMGDSSKLPNSGPGVYTYQTHRAYMRKLFDALNLHENLTLVIHDWGSALGFDKASSHPESIKAIVYMEALLRPPIDGRPMDEPPPRADGSGHSEGRAAGRPEGRPESGPVGRPGGGGAMRVENTGGGGSMFSMLRSPAGDEAVLENNAFVERFFIEGVKNYMSEEDKAEFRRGYEVPGEDRRPTLTWPREVPLGGEPKRNDKIIAAYSKWLVEESQDIPKLFIRANPGAIFANPMMLNFVRTIPNQTEVMVYGGHFVQEVSGDAIGRAIAEWLPTVPEAG